MGKYNAIDVARWFIQRNESTVEAMGSEKITLLKLLKLLYYAEGCSLALDNGSLFPENIVAWEHGPVVVEVYHQYNNDPFNLYFGSKDDIESTEKFSEADADILEEVFQVFGQYTAWALRNKTHNEEPWVEATENGKHFNKIISRETMKSYFKENYIG